MEKFGYGLVLVCFAVAASVLMGTASAATWVVDDDNGTADFANIQVAVDNASAGDTIEVRSGMYVENVDVNKSLTLIGDGADVVTVQSGDGSDHAFEVTADYVNISGFMVTGTGTPYETKAGFYLGGADHCNISNNDASENRVGIHLDSASDNTLSSNNASVNHYGIHLKNSSNNNTLSKNTVSGNTALDSNNGIYLDSSSNNTLTENTASENKVGISIDSSSNNMLLNNTALSNNHYGIYLDSSSNNTLTNNNASSDDKYGIQLSSSSNNTLTNNTASSNGGGIKLYHSNNNRLLSNNASSNHYGIHLESSSNNMVSNNTALNNTWDLYIWNSESAFRDNTLNGTTISFTYEGDVSLKGVGSPAPDPTGWNTIGRFISVTNQSAGAWIFLNFSYSGSDLGYLDESSLKVWKHNGTNWIEDGWNKTRYLDTEGDLVGVNITSFSVFAPAALAAATYIPPDPAGLANTTDRYWVNYTWSAGTGNVTDSYNVSMTETWGNGTTDTFRNVSVAPGGWANITVFAYNRSGTGTLSSGSISDNVRAPGITCDCGNICVNQTGWWRDGGAFNVNGTPIQAAIDSATDGDTICVWNGRYSENVNVNKRLTLIGDGADAVMVRAEDISDHVFEVTADYVDISGFTVTGAVTPYEIKAGFYLGGVDHCNISNNDASENIVGIYLDSASGNTLSSNNASGNDLDGIYLSHSNNNTLTNNNANSNVGGGGCGIRMGSSSNNMLTNNTALKNQFGIELDSSSNNMLTNNKVLENNYDGIRLVSSGNNTLSSNTVLENNRIGILLFDSSNNNTLTNNNANSNVGGGGCGIRMGSSSNNMLTNNTALKNQFGIELDSSSNNMLTNNKVLENNYDGIRLVSSGNNTLSSNTLSDNTWDLYVEGSESTFRDNTLNGTTISFTYAGDVSLKGVGSPAPDPTGWNTIGKFINVTNQSADAWIFLNFSYSGSDLSYLDESSLKVWKHNGTTWIEDCWNGTRYLDTDGDIVGVNITSFSVFAPVALAAAYIPPDPTGLAYTTGRYWVNYTWSAGTGNVTDSYNVSMNKTWRNGTDTFRNVSVAPGGWGDITVFAYNASGTGTLSLGSINDNVQVPGINCTCGNICVNQTGWWRDNGAFNVNGTPIQAAIDSATAGDTICVWNGSYIENVNVNERLTLRSESADVVTVTATRADDHVFEVTADYVNISGFTVTGATGTDKAGICLSGQHCNISDNIVSNNSRGIESEDLNLLTNPGAETGDMSGWTIIANGGNGWSTRGSGYEGDQSFATSYAWCNRSQEVDLLAKGYTDAQLDATPPVNVGEWFAGYGSEWDDPRHHNDYCYLKVELRDEEHAVIDSYDSGVFQTSTGSGWYGPWEQRSHTFSGYGSGLRYVYFEDGGKDWEYWNGHYGPALDAAFVGFGNVGNVGHNTITNNTLTNNGCGISLSSSNNQIYNNYFNNTNNAYDDGNNTWNITKTGGTNIIGGHYLGGNYWRDYAGEDTDGDGLGDTLIPYNSTGNIQNGGDWLPLFYPPAQPTIIYVNTTGWWREDEAFNQSITPIQHVIDNATAGDTIIVENGTYNENVDANKRLTIQSENDSTSTIVHAANSSVPVFEVTADYVNISGFTVKGATQNAGVYLERNVDHCNLSSNNITNNSEGIHLAPTTSGNVINYNNIAGNSRYGINKSVNETVNAKNNWWGDVSGPSGAGNGTGDAVSLYVDYDPWLDSPYPEGKPIYFTNATTNTTDIGTTEINAREVADTDVLINTTAPVNVTIGNYSRNPGASFDGDVGKYIDVHLNNTTNVDRIEIRLYYNDSEIEELDESSLRMYWWNGSEWLNCSDSGVNITNVGNYSGYVWANITSDTIPSVSELNGSLLAARGAFKRQSLGPRSRGRGTYPVLTPTPTTPAPTSLVTVTPTPASIPEPSPTPARSQSVTSTPSPSPTPTSQLRLLTEQDIPLAIAMVAVVASAVYLILRRRK
ncbi:MAG: NosD domain-containing protein [Euryarchaeota archaeon]|nr:NosD domain-containing protein [Euryarchaeota archaeon]